MLLACGSRWLDLNAIECCFGHTPLHLICKRSANEKIIGLLWNSVSHPDSVDKDGKTPFDYLNNKQIKALFTTTTIPDRLKCLCSRIIVNQRLNTVATSELPLTLKNFVCLHDSRRLQYHFERKKTLINRV